jgi:hypothetical protein
MRLKIVLYPLVLRMPLLLLTHGHHNLVIFSPKGATCCCSICTACFCVHPAPETNSASPPNFLPLKITTRGKSVRLKKSSHAACDFLVGRARLSALAVRTALSSRRHYNYRHHRISLLV